MKYLIICVLIITSAFAQNVGDIAPRFSLENCDSSTYYLNDYIGYQIVMVEFFGTWCDHCQASVPALNNIQDKYRGRVKILSVNYKESVEKVQQFIDTYGVSYTILRDTDGKVSKMYGVTAVPKTVFIDKEGKIFHIAASMSEEEMTAVLEGTLEPPEPGDDNDPLKKKILLITEGEKDPIADYYRNAIKQAGFNYDEWDYSEKGFPSFEELVPYTKTGVVIRYFPAKGILSEFSETEMRVYHDYMEHKGNMFISGADFATKHSKSPFFSGGTLTTYEGRVKIDGTTDLSIEPGGIIADLRFVTIDRSAADGDYMTDKIMANNSTSFPVLFYPDGGIAAVSGST